MKKKDTKTANKAQLLKELDKLKKDLFNFRFRKINGQLTDTAKVSQIRRDLAKVLTNINKKK